MTDHCNSFSGRTVPFLGGPFGAMPGFPTLSDMAADPTLAAFLRDRMLLAMGPPPPPPAGTPQAYLAAAAAASRMPPMFASGTGSPQSASVSSMSPTASMASMRLPMGPNDSGTAAAAWYSAALTVNGTGRGNSPGSGPTLEQLNEMYNMQQAALAAQQAQQQHWYSALANGGGRAPMPTQQPQQQQAAQLWAAAMAYAGQGLPPPGSAASMVGPPSNTKMPLPISPTLLKSIVSNTPSAPESDPVKLRKLSSGTRTSPPVTTTTA